MKEKVRELTSFVQFRLRPILLYHIIHISLGPVPETVLDSDWSITSACCLLIVGIYFLAINTHELSEKVEHFDKKKIISKWR